MLHLLSIITVLKSRLDNHRRNQDITDNFKSEIMGTGNRSEISSVV